MTTPSTIHHVLAMLAGELPPGIDGGAAVARLRDLHRIHAVPFRTVEDR